MKPEKLAKLSPQDRQEYENSLKITKAPRRYALRSRPYYIFVKRFEEKMFFKIEILCKLLPAKPALRSRSY
jgi:hypothetical protein